jgi:hypothetical protein
MVRKVLTPPAPDNLAAASRGPRISCNRALSMMNTTPVKSKPVTITIAGIE